MEEKFSIDLCRRKSMLSSSDVVKFVIRGVELWDRKHLCTTMGFIALRSFRNFDLGSTKKRTFMIERRKLSTFFFILFLSLFGITNARSAIEYNIGTGIYKSTNADAIVKIFGRTMRVQRSVSEYHHNHHLRRHRSKYRKNSSNVVTQCPPPPRRLSANACTVKPCEADSDCQDHGARCCYNGCLFTCAHTMNPPPLIDWKTITSKSTLEDFSTDEYDGNLEFDILPGEMLAEYAHSSSFGEICSTTIDEGDILLDCPHGYLCHVEDKGDPKLGIPDRGRCVEVTEDPRENGHELQEDYYY